MNNPYFSTTNVLDITTAPDQPLKRVRVQDYEERFKGRTLSATIERAIMTTYSLLFLDKDETIEKSMKVSCESDEQAMMAAKGEGSDYRAIEVWDRDRLVFLFADSLRAHGR